MYIFFATDTHRQLKLFYPVCVCLRGSAAKNIRADLSFATDAHRRTQTKKCFICSVCVCLRGSAAYCSPPIFSTHTKSIPDAR